MFAGPLARFPQLPPRLHESLNVFRLGRSAIATQAATFQRLRVRRLQARRAQQGEVPADLGKLFLRKWFLGREVGPFRHLFAMIARRPTVVNPRER